MVAFIFTFIILNKCVTLHVLSVITANSCGKLTECEHVLFMSTFCSCCVSIVSFCSYGDICLILTVTVIRWSVNDQDNLQYATFFGYVIFNFIIYGVSYIAIKCSFIVFRKSHIVPAHNFDPNEFFITLL